TISVALAEHGRPLIAALYAPVTDEMFLASRGGGARLNGRRIRATSGEILNGAKVAGPKRYLDRLSPLSPGILGQPKGPPLALRIARVAQGTLDAAFASGGSHDWDLAAADLLVHEAGGALTDFLSRPLKYNEPQSAHGPLIAAGHFCHGALTGLVRDRETEFAEDRGPSSKSAAAGALQESTHVRRIVRRKKTIVGSRARRRAHQARRQRIQGSRQSRYCRRLSELCYGLCRLEGQGTTNRRQRSYALLHRPLASPAR